MNILPLVTAFILLFALGSYTLVHQFRAAVLERLHFNASMKIQNTLSNSVQESEYDSYKGVSRNSKEHHPKKEEKPQVYYSPRKRFNPYKESKLNLRSISSDPKAEKVALALFQNLYEYWTPYNEKLGKQLFDQMGKILKEHPKIETFEELLPYITIEQERIYKLIKGTHKYTLGTTEGYPALGTFFTLDSKMGKPINFSLASKPLLVALFKESIAHQICEAEREKWEPEHKHTPLSQSELEQILLKNRINYADFQDLFSFKYAKQLDNFVIMDKETKIQIKFIK